MGIAANKFRLLFLTAHKSDLEYKLSVINSRRIALTNQSMELAANLSNNIFQTDNTSDLYDGETPGILPGINFPIPGVNLDEDPVPTGDYEEQTLILQAMDKELEMEAEQVKILIEAAKTEVEAVDELLNKNIEKEYKTFNH